MLSSNVKKVQHRKSYSHAYHFNPLTTHTSTHQKSNYKNQIEKLESDLKEKGLIIKNFYFISETFLNRDQDNISLNKVKLLLQHLIGLKTNGNILTNEEITDYSQVYWRPWNNRKHLNIFTADIIADYMEDRGYINIFKSGVDLNNAFMIMGEKK